MAGKKLRRAPPKREAEGSGAGVVGISRSLGHDAWGYSEPDQTIILVLVGIIFDFIHRIRL